MNSSAEPPARLVNVLFGNVILRVIFLEEISLQIHTGGSHNGFRSHEFVSGLGTGNLELVLSEQKEAGEYLYLHTSSKYNPRGLGICRRNSPRIYLVAIVA